MAKRSAPEELNQIANQLEEYLRKAKEAEAQGDLPNAVDIARRAAALAVQTLERLPETFVHGHAIRTRVSEILERVGDTAFDA